MSPARERAPMPASSACSLQALQGNAGAGLRIHVGRAIHRPRAEPVLDEEGEPVGDGVGARLGASEIGQRLGRNGPGALRLAADADGDDRAHLRHDVAGTVPGRGGALDRVEVGDADRERALALAIIDDRLLGFAGIDLRPGHRDSPRDRRSARVWARRNRLASAAPSRMRNLPFRCIGRGKPTGAPFRDVRDAALPRRPCRQPAATGRAASGLSRAERGPHRRRRVHGGAGSRRPRGRGAAGKRRAAIDHRRRVPARVLLVALRRGHRRPRRGAGAVSPSATTAASGRASWRRIP